MNPRTGAATDGSASWVASGCGRSRPAVGYVRLVVGPEAPRSRGFSVEHLLAISSSA